MIERFNIAAKGMDEYIRKTKDRIVNNMSEHTGTQIDPNGNLAVLAGIFAEEIYSINMVHNNRTALIECKGCGSPNNDRYGICTYCGTG